MRDVHDPSEQEPERPDWRRRLDNALKAVGRIEPLVALTVQIGTLTVTLNSIWPGHPQG